MNEILKFKDLPNHYDKMVNSIKRAYPLPSYLKGGIAVDVGANVGAFSITHHNIFDRIIAIEPSKYGSDAIIKRVNDNNITNVEVHRLGVSDKSDETLKLYPYTSPHGGEYNYSSNATTYKKAPKTHYDFDVYEEIISISLEDVFERFNLNKIDYLKIDCEGNEIPFLLNKNLSNIDHIGIEFHYAVQKDTDELMNYLLKSHNLVSGSGTEFSYKNKKI